jgi:hypothetical protein
VAYWCRLLAHDAALAASFTRLIAGNRIPINSEMTDMTTKISINVNPRLRMTTPHIATKGFGTRLSEILKHAASYFKKGNPTAQLVALGSNRYLIPNFIKSMLCPSIIIRRRNRRNVTVFFRKKIRFTRKNKSNPPGTVKIAEADRLLT